MICLRISLVSFVSESKLPPSPHSKSDFKRRFFYSISLETIFLVFQSEQIFFLPKRTTVFHKLNFGLHLPKTALCIVNRKFSKYNFELVL